jgi:TolB-like protein
MFEGFREVRVGILRCVGVMALIAAGTATAQVKPPLVVFDLEGKGASELQAQGSTQSVVRGLRELDVFQVLSADDVRNLLAIERTRQLFGKEGSGVAEMTHSIGARYAVVGSVVPVGRQLQVEIRLLDTEKQSVLSQRTLGPVEKMEAVASQLPGLAQELVGPLLREQQGSLLVQTSESGSEVLVDGTLIGSTPMKAAVDLPRGQHRLQVRKDGFIEQSRPVRVEPKQVSTESFLLMPSPDYAEAWKLRHGRLRIGAYVATAVAVGGLVSAYYMGNNVTGPKYQDRFVPLQYALKAQPLPAQYATADAQSAWAQCGVDPVACSNTAKSLQSEILLDEIITIGLAVVGLAATGTAAYLWLTGEDPNRYTKLIAGLSLTPDGGGLRLTLSF